MKHFLILLFLISFSFGSEVATKEDVNELRKDIRENNRVILEVIKTNQEATNRRFDDVNRRFEDMNSKFNMIVTIMLAGFALIMGYLIKERNSIKKDIKSELEEELNKKADVNLVEKIVIVLEEFGKKNEDIANVLKKHNFIIK